MQRIRTVCAFVQKVLFGEGQQILMERRRGKRLLRHTGCRVLCAFASKLTRARERGEQQGAGAAGALWFFAGLSF